VAAYRAALAERTRERVPLDWAGTQNNLGTALSTLGERESGTARLEEAIAAYRNAYDLYREAGYTQHNDYFEKRIAAVKKLIAKKTAPQKPRPTWKRFLGLK
jgi:exonuclease VII small subunit